MRHLFVPFVVAILVPSIVRGQNATTPFKTDRDYLFRQCAVLNNYVMTPDKKGAVKKGTTKLNARMRAGVNLLVDVWEQYGDLDKRRLAFILATARRESASTFQSVREAASCGDDETCRELAIGRELANQRGQKEPVVPNYASPDPINGLRYYGRGFIQLTFRRNYEKTSTLLKLNLTEDPDRVLETRIAGEILVRGMLGGWFGDHRPLSHYIDGDKADWVAARNNVNPRSKNKPITAAYAIDIDNCLRSKP
jgi:predicted chitinase